MNSPTPPAPQREIRAVLLVAEIHGIPRANDAAGFESLHTTLQKAWKTMETRIADHGGVIGGRFGESILAIWGFTQSGGEDAARCVNCAAALHEALSNIREAGLQLQIGIAAGPVFAARLGTTGDVTVIGEPANQARLLAGVSISDAMLLDPSAAQQLGERFPLRPVDNLHLAGRQGLVQAFSIEYQDLVQDEDASPNRSSLVTHLVGRDAELAALMELHDALDLATDPFLVLVSGGPGVGKSRLMFEFAKEIKRRTRRNFLSARGFLESSRVPFFLWKSLWRDRLGILENEPDQVIADNFLKGVLAIWGKRLGNVTAVETAHMVGSLLGVRWQNSPYLARNAGKPEAQSRQAFILMRELLVRLCETGPLVLFVDDLQYVDEESQRLLRSLLQPGAEPLPVLVVAGVRSNYLESHPEWAQRAYRRLVLQPVRYSPELIRQSYPTAAVFSEPLLARMVQRAGGNPLFMEEIVKSLAFQNDPLAGSPSVASPIPDTLEKMFRLRLDNLSSRAREVLQLASVSGRVFWADAIRAEAKQPVGTGLLNLPDGELEAVVREGLHEAVQAELAFPFAGSGISGEKAFIFKHQVLQSVTYDILPEKYRKFYHFAVAKWLSERVGQGWSAMIAAHFEKAGNTSTALRYYQYAVEDARARGSLAVADQLAKHIRSVRGGENDSQTGM